MRFNVEATGWLGMYLDTDLQFQAHKNIWLENARYAEDSIRRLRLTYGLELGLIQWVQVAAVQAVALYAAEIWWHGQKGLCEEFQRLVNRQGWAV